MSFFFTLLDDSLRPRGSRDALGIEHLWSGVGRKLVGNLTTVTTHLDNFILALVGFHLCAGEKSGQADWENFERFEQLTARARVRCDLPGVIGIRRIRSSADFPVRLGSGREAHILDNPRQGGLWGLYSSALASAGLSDGARRPTDTGMQIVQQFLDAAPGDAWRLALDRRRTLIDEADMAGVEAWVSALVSSAPARKALADCLLSGSSAHQSWHGEVFVQARDFMESRNDAPTARSFLRWLTNESTLLRDFAGRVLWFDEALALSAVTFNWLLGCHGRSVEEIESQLALLAKWPFREPVMPQFAGEIRDDEWRQRANGLFAFCSAMARGEWHVATELLFEHHARVARKRGGAPWCYWEDGRIKVVMNITPGVLPAAEELVGERFSAWMDAHTHGFFLRSFLDILDQAGLVEQGETA
jgi:hypothetical protein